MLPRFLRLRSAHGHFRVATYNIHKGVQGIGPPAGWKSTTSAMRWSSWTPTWCACRRCARCTAASSTTSPLARAAAGRIPRARGLPRRVPDQCHHPPWRAWQRAADALGRWCRRGMRTCPTTASSSAACCMSGAGARPAGACDRAAPGPDRRAAARQVGSCSSSSSARCRTARRWWWRVISMTGAPNCGRP
jgi:hypothetical protein